MSKYKVVVIDDEKLARDIIISYLSEDSEIEVIGQCDNGFEGFKQINELKPNIIFLDIMMPKVTGLEMLELIDHPPIIIFSTAYDQYAIDAFEKNAVDYLLKPYSEERFADALSKAKKKVGLEQTLPSSITRDIRQSTSGKEPLSRIAVKTGAKIQIIPVEKINYLEAMDDYVKLHTADGTFLKQNTMKYFETSLPPEDFARIHRSYIVKVKNINRLEQMGKESHIVILNDQTTLNVSRTGYSKLKEILGF
ncbi:MAG: LytTR family transcriptional regulator DNA-binding domain-containing protein [Cyclobacteriaceae bacterium]